MLLNELANTISSGGEIVLEHVLPALHGIEHRQNSTQGRQVTRREGGVQVGQGHALELALQLVELLLSVVVIGQGTQRRQRMAQELEFFAALFQVPGFHSVLNAGNQAAPFLRL